MKTRNRDAGSKELMRLGLYLFVAYLEFSAGTSLCAMEPVLRSTLYKGGPFVQSLAFSPDGKKLVGVCDDTVILWDVHSGETILSFEAQGTVTSMAFCPDGKTIATAGACTGTIELWEVAGRKSNARPSTSDSEFDQWYSSSTALTFTPDGKTLAAAGIDAGVWLFDLATGKIRAKMTHSLTDRPIACAPDGKTLATGSDSFAIALWNLQGREYTTRLSGHTSYITALAFGPQSKTLVSASKDRTVKVWDLDNGKSIHTLTGHTGAVDCISLSSDGRLLASGSRDTTIRLWDMSAGESIASLKGHEYGISCVAFSPDGQILASGCDGGTVRLWDLNRNKKAEKNRCRCRPLRCSEKLPTPVLIRRPYIICTKENESPDNDAC